MRGFLLYILFLLQVTLHAQVELLSFEFKEVTTQPLSDNLLIISCNDCLYDDEFQPFLQKSVNGVINNYQIANIQSVACNQEELNIIQNWQLNNTPLIAISKSKTKSQGKYLIKVFPVLKKGKIFLVKIKCYLKSRHKNTKNMRTFYMKVRKSFSKLTLKPSVCRFTQSVVLRLIHSLST